MMQAERRRPVSSWVQRGDAQRGEMISQKLWRMVRGENKALVRAKTKLSRKLSESNLSLVRSSK